MTEKLHHNLYNMLMLTILLNVPPWLSVFTECLLHCVIHWHVTSMFKVASICKKILILLCRNNSNWYVRCWFPIYSKQCTLINNVFKRLLLLNHQPNFHQTTMILVWPFTNLVQFINPTAYMCIILQKVKISPNPHLWSDFQENKRFKTYACNCYITSPEQFIVVCHQLFGNGLTLYQLWQVFTKVFSQKKKNTHYNLATLPF